MVEELMAFASDLIKVDDPLEAEMLGASFAALGSAAEDFEEFLAAGFVPAIEAHGGAEALAMLLAVASVAPEGPDRAVRDAIRRLRDAGVAPPQWAAELDQPVTVADCQRLSDPGGAGSMLVCSFHRAGRGHATVTSVDDLDCGAADQILLFDAEQLPQVLESIHEDARANGFTVATESLDPADFRWHVEKALEARAVHDADDDIVDEPEDADDDGPDYPALAWLLKARMSALPAPTRPAPPHGDEDNHHTAFDALQAIDDHAEVPTPRGRSRSTRLSAKRKKSDGPAPMYQIKVGLRGARPPIWRRLEVPADISLAKLHRVIQIAFDWDDSHMHVFETPYGSFGTADRELGHRAEAPVTLEQVAPTVKSKVTYTYDFGDDWEHDIVVEKVLDRLQATVYPRCTDGRKAAPPDDCGGLWGYADLVEVLTDPSHPDHEERLDWLGLEDASEFDPNHFDAEPINQALSRLR
jgi:Plasmid pRiA4b ORF-3-like protein